MRKPKVKNKYKLKMADIEKLKIGDRSQICKPLFWRNDIIKAWYISETTIKSEKDIRFRTYNDYWIGIYDNGKLRVNCNAYGGMCGYRFNIFFNPSTIENELDLEIQEKLLAKINKLIDKGILLLS